MCHVRGGTVATLSPDGRACVRGVTGYQSVKLSFICALVSCNTAKRLICGELIAVRTLRFFISSRSADPTCRVATVPSQVIRGAASAPAVTLRTVATDGEYADGPARMLLPLLGIYALGTVSLQGFNLVYLRVAQDIGAGDASGLITAIPGIVLGGPVGLIGGAATGAVIGGSVAYMRRGRRIR